MEFTWRETNISPQEKLVMLAIADACDSTYLAMFHGVDYLSERTCMSTKTIKNHTKNLVTKGLIRKCRRHRPDGSRAPDVLLINCTLICKPEYRDLPDHFLKDVLGDLSEGSVTYGAPNMPITTIQSVPGPSHAQSSDKDIAIDPSVLVSRLKHPETPVNKPSRANLGQEPMGDHRGAGLTRGEIDRELFRAAQQEPQQTSGLAVKSIMNVLPLETAKSVNSPGEGESYPVTKSPLPDFASDKIAFGDDGMPILIKNEWVPTQQEWQELRMCLNEPQVESLVAQIEGAVHDQMNREAVPEIPSHLREVGERISLWVNAGCISDPEKMDVVSKEWAMMVQILHPIQGIRPHEAMDGPYLRIGIASFSEESPVAWQRAAGWSLQCLLAVISYVRDRGVSPEEWLGLCDAAKTELNALPWSGGDARKYGPERVMLTEAMKGVRL